MLVEQHHWHYPFLICLWHLWLSLHFTQEGLWNLQQLCPVQHRTVFCPAQNCVLCGGAVPVGPRSWRMVYWSREGAREHELSFDLGNEFQECLFIVSSGIIFLTISVCALTWYSFHCRCNVHSFIFFVLVMVPAGIHSMPRRETCKIPQALQTWLGWRVLVDACGFEKVLKFVTCPLSFSLSSCSQRFFKFKYQRLVWNNLFLQSLVLRTHY